MGDWCKGNQWKRELLGGPQPEMRFKVWATPRKRPSAFFWVTIWRTLGQARARMKMLEASENPRTDTAMGACFAWDLTAHNEGRDKPGLLLPEMGEIVLCLKWCRVGIIAHEALHAAHRVRERMERINIEPDDETPEERLCIITGDIAMQVVKGYHARLKRK